MYYSHRVSSDILSSTRVFKQKTWSDGLKTKKKPQVDIKYKLKVLIY